MACDMIRAVIVTFWRLLDVFDSNSNSYINVNVNTYIHFRLEWYFIDETKFNVELIEKFYNFLRYLKKEKQYKLIM